MVTLGLDRDCTVQVFGGMFLNSASFNNILGRMIFYVVGEIMTRNDNKNGHLWNINFNFVYKTKRTIIRKKLCFMS